MKTFNLNAAMIHMTTQNFCSLSFVYLSISLQFEIEYASLEFAVKLCSKFAPNSNSTSVKMFCFTSIKFFCEIENDQIKFFDGKQINSQDHTRIISLSYIKPHVYQNIFQQYFYSRQKNHNLLKPQHLSLICKQN